MRPKDEGRKMDVYRFVTSFMKERGVCPTTLEIGNTHGSECEWLAGFCSSTDSIAKLLRSLGFRVKEIVECDGAEWVETTSGVIVYVNTEWSRGFVAGRSKNG